MAEDNKYGIAAALSEALEAAVFADSSACYKAYDMIEKYAYDQDITVEEEDETSSMDGSDSAPASAMDRTKKVTTVGSTDLAMAQFTMYGPDGKSRTVSIPKITMMPLPLLHVTQASFDIEMTANIENSASNEGRMDVQTPAPDIPTNTDATGGSRPVGSRPSSNAIAGSRPSSRPSRPSSNITSSGSQDESTPTVTRPTSDTISRTGSRVARGYRAVRRSDGTVLRVQASSEERAAEARRKARTGITSTASTVTNQQMVVGNKTTTTESNQSTINMKVRIDMQQAELPDGIKLLLQAAANSLQVAANDLSDVVK